MNVSVIVIGDELLMGKVADTNSGFIARAIAPAGWSVKRVETVGDDAQDITAAVERSLSETPIALLTGGLGPTKDDITKGALCAFMGCGLRRDAGALDNARRVMSARGREFNELTAGQALVPEACEVINNDVGTAPLLWFERDGKTLVAMPGVPWEMEKMFTAKVLPRLLEQYGGGASIGHRYIKAAGMSESAIAEALAGIEQGLPSWAHIAYLPMAGYVQLRIDGFNADSAALNTLLDDTVAAVRSKLGGSILSLSDAPLAKELLDMLDSRGLSVATAESCTGGNIAHAITMIPGSSSAMKGGVVAYCNSVKESVLGVSGDTLKELGAVSIPVVEQMAAGARRALASDVGISTTGIAGPGGGVPGKPVGTVCMAVSVADEIVSATCHFAGDRRRVIESATAQAMIMAIRLLQKKQ